MSGSRQNASKRQSSRKTRFQQLIIRATVHSYGLKIHHLIKLKLNVTANVLCYCIWRIIRLGLRIVDEYYKRRILVNVGRHWLSIKTDKIKNSLINKTGNIKKQTNTKNNRGINIEEKVWKLLQFVYWC